jgi:hypothetical protein
MTNSSKSACAALMAGFLGCLPPPDDAAPSADIEDVSSALTDCAYTGNGVAGTNGVAYKANVVSHGGAMHPNNPVYIDFWGTYGADKTKAAERQGFVSDATALLRSIGFWNGISEYGNLHGEVVSSTTSHATMTGAKISNKTFEDELATELKSGKLPYNVDGIYVVRLGPENSSVNAPNAGAGYHSSFSYNGQNIRYAVLMSGGTPTKLLSHEIAEAVTDPPNGYSDPQFPGEGEVGDLCNGQGVTMAGLMSQKQWSQATCSCVGSNNKYTSLQFDSGDNMLFADIDWQPGQFKAECAKGEQVTGLSAATSTLVAHKALCAPMGKTAAPAAADTAEFVNANSGFTGGWDWDPGFFKGQCGWDRDIVGVSQVPGGKLGALRCAYDLGYNSPVSQSACTVHTVNTAGAQSNPDKPADWDVGFYKTECDVSTEIMKGVSHDGSGHLHAILCCTGVRKSWAFGGIYQIDDCSASNNVPNPRTGGLTCPAGYVSFRSTRHLDPETGCGGWDFFCAKASTTEGTSWDNFHQVDDCRVDNFGPSCTSGETLQRIGRAMAPESGCGSTQFMCQSSLINAPFHFAGTYLVDDCGQNSNVNPFTSTLGCPPGYTGVQYGRVKTAEGSQCGAGVFVCLN